MDTSTSRSHILDAFISSCDGKMSTPQCFHIVKHTDCNTIDRENTNKYDNDNFRIISHIRKQKEENWLPAVLNDVNSKYHILLKRGQLQMLKNPLIFYKNVMINSKYLALIVVPQSL